MSWFEELMGFPEESGEQVRANCELEDDGEVLVSKANQKRYRIGAFEIPSLKQLRQRTDSIPGNGNLSLSETVANVQDLHQLEENAGALFQVASQFNLLEMVSPAVTPEQGVGIYQYDATQGPACAIAAGAGTVYRNYLVPVGDQTGQSETKQIDCLEEIGGAMGNEGGLPWEMRNGYALPSEAGLDRINDILSALGDAERDRLREKLRVGIHTDVEVTLNDCGNLVSQLYGSAMPVAYSGIPSASWEAFARLVLEASYEACLRAAVLNAKATGNTRVFLTLLGGGAFGNPQCWIFDAINRALNLVKDHSLDVRIVSYGSSSPEVVYFIEEWEEDNK